MRLITTPRFCDLLLASALFQRPVVGLVRAFVTTTISQRSSFRFHSEVPSSSTRFFSGRKRVRRPSLPTNVPLVLDHDETTENNDNIDKNNDDIDEDEEEIPSTVVEAGHVYYVATPLGNLKDITLRAIEVLTNADVICAEDTRHTIKLLRRLDLPYKELLSHHEHNWQEQLPKILGMIQNGKSVAVVR